MTTPLLEGINARVEDGRVVGAKMSKSADNYVGITESPSEMLQKLMLVGDQVIWRYMDLLSPKPTEELRAIRAEVEAGQKSVIEVKQDFAMEIVTRFHDEKSAADALSRRRAVAGGSLPDDIEHIEVPAEGDEVWIAKVIASAGLAKSTSDANRLVQGGAVHLDGRQLTKADAQEKLRKGTRYLLRVGSKNRRFAYVTLV
jgi:tyrosyl-tRNA synthetase